PFSLINHQQLTPLVAKKPGVQPGSCHCLSHLCTSSPIMTGFSAHIPAFLLPFLMPHLLIDHFETYINHFTIISPALTFLLSTTFKLYRPL
ncbi:MAG: hypothetical protein ACJ8GL_09810, partial [Bacillus sp. (in: firmicutes)]